MAYGASELNSIQSKLTEFIEQSLQSAAPHVEMFVI